MYSPTHKALFVHIPKTAGQSIEATFLQALGLSWEERAPLLLRPSDDTRGPDRLAHLYAREYVALGHLTQAEFEASTRFTVVRHPYARAVSAFRFDLRQGRIADLDPAGISNQFDQFIQQDFETDRSSLARHLEPQCSYVFDRDETCLVPRVIRFERLATELAPLLQQLLGCAVTLPRRNSSKLAAEFTQQSLSAAQKAQLYARYRQDFDAFGYRP